MAFCEALDPSGIRAMLEVQILVFIAWSHFLLDCLDLPRCEPVAFPSSHGSAQSLLRHCLPYHDSLCSQMLSLSPAFPPPTAHWASLLCLLSFAASGTPHSGAMQISAALLAVAAPGTPHSGAMRNALRSDCSSPCRGTLAAAKTGLHVQCLFL